MKTYSNEPEDINTIFENGYKMVKVTFIIAALLAILNLIA